MIAKIIHRAIPTAPVDHYGSDSSSTKEEEKTIPFLRRLVDMLSENDDIISFYPGSVVNGKVTLGRIVVHDRLAMENATLPKYFNHNSFASLRRQLNYFSFIRMGKGRQKGATYCNEGVIVMHDILRLRRRANVGGTSPITSCTASSTKRERSPSLISASSSDDIDSRRKLSQSRPSRKVQATTILPPSSAASIHENPQPSSKPEIALDLTIPASKHGCSFYSPPSYKQHAGDADVLAGCRALLSFSRSTAGEIVA